MKSMQLWSATALVLVSNAAVNATYNNNNNLRRREVVSLPSNNSSNNVLCRVTTFHQLTELKQDQVESKAETHCIPIIDHKYEDDNSFPIQLPDNMLATYESEIAHGELFVSISDALYDNEELFIGDQAQYTVVNDHNYRHLFERHLQSTTQVSVAVVRISTPNQSPPASASAISSALFGSNGMQKQYSDCSFGRTQLTNNGVFDVKISQTTAELGGDWSKVVDAAQKQILLDRGLTSVQQLANKVLMCLPPGTGDWAASAGVNSWRAQFNSDWCTSLSATMHEVGHLFGLLHAQKDYKEYDDYTGYMSASYKNSDWPKKCFNGQNNDHFGWYSDKQLKFDPLTEGGKLVQLASFVDYAKASGAYVNIAISGKYYLQYNVAEGFNVNTQDKANQVTLTEKYSSGSNLITGLSPGNEWKISNFNSSGKTLLIRACGSGSGTNGAKTMLMSIAFDVSLCDTYQGSTRFDVPSGGGGGGCFSGENKIDVLGKGIVKMESLNIGDYVRVANGEFSQVYSFGHFDKTAPTDYLQFFSDDGDNSPLEITADHMVYVSSGDVVRASEVKVGDQLLGHDNKVAEIRTVKRYGVYAPVTFTGDIVVSGVVASSYVSLLETVSARIVNKASHITMGMHRLVCKFDFNLCQNETYTNDGINDWIATAVRFVMELNQHNIFIQIAAWTLAIPLLAAVYFVEVFLSFSPILVFPLSFMVVLGYHSFGSVRLGNKK